VGTCIKKWDAPPPERSTAESRTAYTAPMNKRGMRIRVVGPSWVDSSEMGCGPGLAGVGTPGRYHATCASNLRASPLQRLPVADLWPSDLLRRHLRGASSYWPRKRLRGGRRFPPTWWLVVQLSGSWPRTWPPCAKRGSVAGGWFPYAFTRLRPGRPPYAVPTLRPPVLPRPVPGRRLARPCPPTLPTCPRLRPRLPPPVPLFRGPAALLADVATFVNYLPLPARMLEALLSWGLISSCGGRENHTPALLPTGLVRFLGRVVVLVTRLRRPCWRPGIALNPPLCRRSADVTSALRAGRHRCLQRDSTKPGLPAQLLRGWARGGDLPGKADLRNNRLLPAAPPGRADIARRAPRAPPDHTLQNRPDHPAVHCRAVITPCGLRLIGRAQCAAPSGVHVFV